MKLVCDNARFVSKGAHTFENGDTVYNVQVGGMDDGNLMRASVNRKLQEELQLFDVSYAIEVNVETNGYRNYIELVSAVPN